MAEPKYLNHYGLVDIAGKILESMISQKLTTQEQSYIISYLYKLIKTHDNFTGMKASAMTMAYLKQQEENEHTKKSKNM